MHTRFLFLKNIATLDVRSLAIFRITLACILLWFFTRNIIDTNQWFSPSGLIPQSLALQETSEEFRWHWNYLFFIDAEWLSYLLGLIGIACSILLLIGWHTKWISPIIWLLVLSFNCRNLIITDGAYWVLTSALFWSMFLPLETIWSVDAQKGRIRMPCIIANIGFILSVAYLYFFAALNKTDPAWTSNYSAVWLALTSHLSNAFAYKIASYTQLTQITTAIVLWSEIFIGILLLIGSFARFFGVLLIIILHLCVLLTFNIELFPWIGLVTALPMLPSSAWKYIHLPVIPVTMIPLSFKKRWLQFIISGILLCIIVSISIMNIDSIRPNKQLLPLVIKKTIISLGLLQQWSMFSSQSEIRHYALFTGELSNKRYSNLNEWLWHKNRLDLTNEEVDTWYTAPSPQKMADRFGSMRFLRFYNRIEVSPIVRNKASEAICKEWNELYPSDPLQKIFYIIGIDRRFFPVLKFVREPLWTFAVYSCVEHMEVSL